MVSNKLNIFFETKIGNTLTYETHFSILLYIAIYTYIAIHRNTVHNIAHVNVSFSYHTLFTKQSTHSHDMGISLSFC